MRVFEVRTQSFVSQPGRRVEVTDAQGTRDVVVAPTTGGLESPFLIVKENDVEAAFAYAGDMPLARVDEAGNPVYYLTDAMGSIIGLVDGNGNEIADFRYDSFGNLQTPEALPSELGEDFRPILIQIFYLKKEPQTQQMANPKPGWLEI